MNKIIVSLIVALLIPSMTFSLISCSTKKNGYNANSSSEEYTKPAELENNTYNIATDKQTSNI